MLGPSAISAASLILFALRVDDSRFFAEAPFTPNVEVGFFIALLGVGWGVVAALGMSMTGSSPGGPLVIAAVVVVTVLVAALYASGIANQDRVADPFDEPIPEATEGPPPSN